MRVITYLFLDLIRFVFFTISPTPESYSRSLHDALPICNLCVDVCPVEGCITMRQLDKGATDPRTGTVVGDYANWTTHPNNPAAQAAE